MKRKMNKVSVDRINLKYRDDIALRIYCFINNNFEPYGAFAQKNHHVKKGKVQAEIDKIKSCYKHIKKGGSIPPIKILMKHSHMYPLDGAKRLSSSYALNKDVEIQVQPMSEEYRLAKPFNIDCDKFSNVPDNIKEMLTLRKYIMEQVRYYKIDGKKMCCHSVPEVGIIGEKDCSRFVNELGDIEGKKILDIDPKMGMISIECAKRGAIVDGASIMIRYHEIAQSLKKFFNLESINFYPVEEHENSISPFDFYDIILSSNKSIIDNLIFKGEVDGRKVFVYGEN